MEEYAYRAYCDICNTPSQWLSAAYQARGWRDLHFESVHPDNPMKKQNCRIQRDTVEVSGLEVNSTAEEIFDYES